MLKKIALASMLLVVGNAHAGLWNAYNLHRMATEPDNMELKATVQAEIVSDPESAKGWFHDWVYYPQQYMYGIRWPELGLNLLRWANDQRSYDWNAAVWLPEFGVPIYQQDSLIDLERTTNYQVQFEPMVGTVHHDYLMADTYKPIHKLNATSQRLLTMGLPPVGPDDMPVVICRLGNSIMSPFLEMSQAQRVEFSLTTGLPLNRCLYGEKYSQYWKDRYHDFLDAFHDKTQANNPKSSW